MKSNKYKRVLIHPDLPKRERQLAANFRKVVNAAQNRDVKLFVKWSSVCSSKWSSADESTPTQGESHLQGRHLRVEKRSHNFQHDEYEEMDIYVFNSPQTGYRENVDNRQYSSELNATGRHRNNQNFVRSGKDMSSSGGRSSAHGWSSCIWDTYCGSKGAFEI